MRRKTILLAILALFIFALPITAQESDIPTTYEGRFSFTIPQGFRVLESLTTDTVRLEREDSALIFVGPDSFNAVVGDTEFDNDGEALVFYLERTGYSIIIRDDEGITFAENVLAFTPVELDRRNVLGSARLLDLGNNRRGVLISLSATGDVPDTHIIVDSLNYPPDLLDVIRNAEGTVLFLAAIRATGLDEDLATGDYTIFVPKDDAFEAAIAELGYTSIATLLSEDIDIAEAVLRNHLIEGRVIFPDDLNSAYSELDVDVTIQGIEIIAPNLEAYNGVVHIIGGVLLPDFDLIPETE